MSDPDDATLRAFLDGTLDEADAERVAEGLARDPDLAARLEALAGASSSGALTDDLSGDLLAAAFADEAQSDEGGPLPEVPGYADLRILQRGGQGVVYFARQTSTGRTVALKVLEASRRGNRRQQLRFEREIDLASTLEHPNVVSVFDRGHTATGLPWFAMEAVQGLPFDRHASEHDLDLDARLQLFDRLCAALAFAHRRGVLHRDLKPENVLVDPSGEPRVLDFGLAKLPGDESTAETMTRSGEFVGTLAFAAPEQLLGDGSLLDMRTDVHALGLLLYRLLTGAHPFATDGALGDLVQRITEEEPPPPSRATGRLDGVDADLDALCLTCLAKDPAERYASVDALRQDLERWRRGEPLSARADRRGYVLRRQLRRFRWALAGLLVLVAGLSVATVVSRRALAEARAEATRASNLGDFLVETLLSAVPGTEPADVTVRELARRAGEDVSTRFADEPASEATVRTAIGRVLRATGEYAAAEDHLRHAWTLAERSLGSQHEQTLSARTHLAYALVARGDHDEARRLLDALTEPLAALPPAHSVRQQAALARGVLHVAHGRAADAVQEVRATVEAARAADDLLGAGSLLAFLADVLREAGRPAEALAVGRDAEGVLGEARGRDHALVELVRHNQALALADLGSPHEALALLEPTAERMTAELGEDHPGAVMARTNLAGLRASVGRIEPAVQALVPLVELCQRRFGDGHRLTHDALHGLGVVLSTVGQVRDAAPLLEAAHAGRLEQLGPDHRSSLRTQIELAKVVGRLGRLDEAESLLREALRRAEEAAGPGSLETLAARQVLGVLLIDTDRPEEAEAVLDRGWQAAREALPPHNPQPYELRQQRAVAMGRQGRRAEALAEMEAVFGDLLRTEATPGHLTALALSEAVALGEALGDQAALLRWQDHHQALLKKIDESE